VVAVSDWLDFPRWLAIALPVVICGGALIQWVTRLVRWAAARQRTAQP
jgi:hypothetical protein